MGDNAGAATVTLAAATANQVVAKRQKNRRVGISISNTGANTAYLNPSDSQAPVVGQGIELLSGSTWYDSDSETYQCWSGSISAISTAGTTLSVWERVRS
jgi:hypothetical protein